MSREFHRDIFFVRKNVTINDIQKIMEEWFPAGIAWKGDNIGLQIGRPETTVKNILVALEATMDVVEEAKQKNANLIVTHHPLIFQPLRSITPQTPVGAIALALAESGIALYAAHTNLDSARGGVNDVLGAVLGLLNARVLSPLEGRLKKIAVFVPRTHVEQVADAMYAAGGGGFIKYAECSFRSDGIGTFKGTNDARPFLGSVGVLERAEETKLEMLVPGWKASSVVRAMLAAHPYEEVAYDVYPIENTNPEFGLGVIGTLPKPMSAKKFLLHVKKVLGTPMLRTAGRTDGIISTVAACGGSGAEFIELAARQQADAYVTSDLKYHTMQEAPHDLLLVDAGHYETERPVLPVLTERLQKFVRHQKAKVRVFTTTHKTTTIETI
jgi:dinuclear metal center YbgI/SA1388 family protein